MSTSPNRILFISHEATRTGAPILFLNLIQEIRKLHNCHLEIVLLNDGPIKKDFANAAPTYVLRNFYSETVRKYLKKLHVYRLTKEYRYRKAIFNKVKNSDVVFANTVAGYYFLRECSLEGTKVFYYIHELHYSIKRMFSHEELTAIQNMSKKIFVPALFVKNFLIDTYGFDERKISILKYHVPYNISLPDKGNFQRKSFVVGACGNLTLRKGFDLFSLIVREIILSKKVLDIRFLWIGVDKKNLEERLTFEFDLQKLGILPFVEIVESTENVLEWIKKLDVLLLTSREDAYPLVIMEAASQGIPTIYFEGAGGAGEFVKDGGIGVPYLDINAYVNAILDVKGDSNLLKCLSENSIKNFIQERELLDIRGLTAELMK